MTRIFLPEGSGRRIDAQGFSYERTDWFNEWQVGLPFNDMSGLLSFVSNEIERLEAFQPADPAGALLELLKWKARFGETVIPASWRGIFTGCLYPDWAGVVLLAVCRTVGHAARWIDASHAALMRRLQSESGCR